MEPDAHSGGAGSRVFRGNSGPEHKALFLRGNRTLVVTFDNLDDVRQDPDRMPWGVNFIAATGCSSLGIMAHGPTWYRDAHVIRFFQEMGEDGFFDGFGQGRVLRHVHGGLRRRGLFGGRPRRQR